MASALLDEETTKKVIRQVEFYFSDSNLPRDNFLKKTISESDDGMVSLALICSFTRMRNHLNLGDAKPDDVAEDTVKAVAETLRSSTSLKISEDGLKVGRSTELPKPEELIEQLDVRTVAVSPFEYDVKREDVEAFFAKVSQVTSIRLPRVVGDKKIFCGTALVEFSTEEEAENILKESFEFAGAPLELKPKKDFDVEREKETQEHENSHQKGKNSSSTANERSYPKGLIVAFTLKKASNEGSDEQNGTVKPENGSSNGGDTVSSENAAEETAPNSEVEDVQTENADNKMDTESEKKETREVEQEEKVTSEENSPVENEKKEVKPTAASFRNNKDVVMREDLKSVFQKFGNVKFIDFEMGAESGYIRFEEPEAAQKARAAAVLAHQGGLAVKNFIATLEPVIGDAERDYWVLLSGNQEKHRDFKGNRGRGRNNRGWKNGRSRDNGSGRPAKAQKV